MKAKKLAKLIEKVYVTTGLAKAAISIEHEGLVKVVEGDEPFITTYYFTLIGDDVVVYSVTKDVTSDKLAISQKNFKKLVKIVCSVRGL